MPSPSPCLLPGEAVRARGERWRVVHLAAYEACQIVELAGAEPGNAGRTARVILPFEPIDRLAYDVDRPRVVSASTWRRAAAAALADAAPRWHSLRAAANADIALLPFQLEPAMAMARGRAARLLLADEVGLGKTIQAGLIVAELLARERDARVLIATPAGLRGQWHDELRRRFAVDATIVDAAWLARAAAELPLDVNPWAVAQVSIASIDFLKRPDVVRSLEALTWDLAAFDEAHALGGRSDRAAAAHLVATRARRVVLITATPHSGDDEAFERLRDLGRLGDSDAILTFRRSRAQAGLRGARVSRRLNLALTAAEARMHHALNAYAARISRDAPPELAAAARLAMLVLARRASSSAASLARSLERRMALLGDAADSGAFQPRLPLEDGLIAEDDEPSLELAAPGLREAAVEREALRDVLSAARAVHTESKIRALRRYLARTREPALVFTEYRDTLRHVAEALGVEAAVLHGGLSPAERALAAREFTHGAAPLLLATDAASEGLNLHRRCRLVINLDVPWTPLRLEQRIGRVDRIGQKRRVHAVTFVARGTGETIVAVSLAARAQRAERSAPYEAAEEGGSLRAAAQDEAERLAWLRQLAATCSPSRPRQGRPVLTLLKGRRQAPLIVVRFFFIDATGTTFWETLVGLSVTALCDARGVSARGLFETAIRDHGLSLAAAAAAALDASLRTLSLDLRESAAPLLARDRAILERIGLQDARLARPLLQPGLFDRRAVRDADARRRVVAEAAGRIERRMVALERSCAPETGARALVFAAAWR